MAKNIYITTSIPYLNADLHLGHVLEFVQADFLARFYKKLGKKVFFATGSDENSLKVAKKAEENKLPVQEFTDLKVKTILNLLDFLNIEYDHFQRTSSENHKKAVRYFFNEIKQDIYQKDYQGLYCPECEAFLKPEELENGLCPVHKIEPTLVKEKNYFFKQTKYKKDLLNLINQNKLLIIPEKRKAETLSWLDELEDANISRSISRARGWGVTLPNDEDQIFYVWFDALINYLSNLGYPEMTETLKTFWLSEEAEIIHILGKDIFRFHTIMWPSMLLAAKLKVPNKIFVHGFILLNGEKMSKSRGNFIDPFELGKIYNSDVIRYFLLREVPAYEDGNFSLERIEKRYLDDLAHGLGNLVSRVASLLSGGFPFEIKANYLEKEQLNLKKEFISFSQLFKFNKALDNLWLFIKEIDRYINEKKPWQKNCQNKEEVFSTLWLGLKEINYWLELIMPETSKKVEKIFDLRNNIKPNIKEAKSIGVLFPKR